MQSHAHRLTDPRITSDLVGLNIEGTAASGARLTIHMFTPRAGDPALEASRLRKEAATHGDLVFSTTKDRVSLDGSHVDAVRSGSYEAYTDPPEDAIVRRGALAALAARITGRDADGGDAWRSRQSDVLRSIGSGGVDRDRVAQTESPWDAAPTPTAGSAPKRGFGGSDPARGFGGGTHTIDGKHWTEDPAVWAEIEEDLRHRADLERIANWDGRLLQDLPLSTIREGYGHALVPSLERTVPEEYRGDVEGAHDASGYPGRDENSEWYSVPSARILAVDSLGQALIMTGVSIPYLGADHQEVAIEKIEHARFIIDRLRAETAEPNVPVRGADERPHSPAGATSAAKGPRGQDDIAAAHAADRVGPSIG